MFDTLPDMEWGLATAIDEVLAVDPSALPDAELHDALIAARREVSRLSAAVARLGREWDARKVWARDGSRSSWSRFARDTGTSGATAQRELRRAEQLESMPVTEAAVADGSLSIDKADLLAKAVEPGVEALFEADEADLVDDIKRMRFSEAQRHVKTWLDDAHARAGVPPPDPSEARELNLTRVFDGTVDVVAKLDPVGGTAVTEELRRREEALYRDDVAEAKARVGDDFTPADLRRTGTQRRADALVAMAKRSALVSDTAPLPRALISIVCGEQTFAKVCELAADRTVITAEQLVPHLVEADIERIVYGSPDRIIAVGERERFFTGALRRAIEIRDRECRHTCGCDETAEHGEIDHEIPFSEGGLTTQENGRCLCRPHNLARNREGPSDTS